MVYLHTKNPNLAIFWNLGMEIVDTYYGHLVYFGPFGIYLGHLVYFLAVWYIFGPFGIFFPKKIWQPVSASFFFSFR
jgi:hypothetical protein